MTYAPRCLQLKGNFDTLTSVHNIWSV